MLSNYNYYKLEELLMKESRLYTFGERMYLSRVVLVRLQYTLHGTVCLDKFNTS